METILLTITNSDKMPWVLGIIASLIAYFFHVAQKGENPFDFKEMFYDPDTKLTSLTRFGNFVALCISSWGFIYLVVHNQLTEFYFTGYMTVWASVNLISKGIAAVTSKKTDGTTSTK
jgi:hypothetical protein